MTGVIFCVGWFLLLLTAPMRRATSKPTIAMSIKSSRREKAFFIDANPFQVGGPMGGLSFLLVVLG